MSVSLARLSRLLGALKRHCPAPFEGSVVFNAHTEDNMAKQPKAENDDEETKDVEAMPGVHVQKPAVSTGWLLKVLFEEPQGVEQAQKQKKWWRLAWAIGLAIVLIEVLVSLGWWRCHA
jgi:hypothetical protein